MPEDLLRETDSLMNISYFINFDDKEAISYNGCPTGFLWLDYAGCFL